MCAIQQDQPAWGSALQHVLMCISTNIQGKIKSLLKLHDLALIIDQIKRDGLSEASFNAIILIFKVTNRPLNSNRYKRNP